MTHTRTEADNEALALRVSNEADVSIEVTDCLIVRGNGKTESIPWFMRLEEEETVFVPRGPVLLGPKDHVSWHWTETDHE